MSFIPCSEHSDFYSGCLICDIEKLTTECDALKLQLSGRTYCHNNPAVEAENLRLREALLKERSYCHPHSEHYEQINQALTDTPNTEAIAKVLEAAKVVERELSDTFNEAGTELPVACFDSIKSPLPSSQGGDQVTYRTMCLLIACVCLMGVILTCSIAATGSSYTDEGVTLEQAIERLARQSDARLGW